MSFTVIEVDATLATRCRLPLRRIPIRTASVGRIMRSECVDVDALVDELVSLLSEHPADAPVLAHTTARLALFASRRSADDGFAESAKHYAEIAEMLKPDDPEIGAHTALVFHGAAEFDEAARRYEALLAADRHGQLIHLRSMTARLHLDRGFPLRAKRAIEPAMKAAPTDSNAYAISASADDEAALERLDPESEVQRLTRNTPMYPNADSSRFPMLTLSRGRRVVVDERRADGWLRVRTADARSGWLRGAPPTPVPTMPPPPPT